MSVKFWESPTVNNWRTTLGVAIDDNDTAIGLVSTASMNPSHLVVPGVLVIDRISSSESDTPGTREYISFATIPLGASGVTIAGVSRGLGGSTAQSHGASSIIEGILSVTHWEDLVDFLQADHQSYGTHNVLSHVRQISITGVSGASGIKGNVVIVPGSNVSIYAVSGASGHSWINITGSPVTLPPFQYNGSLISGTYVTPAIIVDHTSTIRSISAVLKSPISSASLLLDVNQNMTSVFTVQATRLSILGGRTYASTASIGTTALSPGNILTLDIDAVGGTGGQDMTCLIEV